MVAISARGSTKGDVAVLAILVRQRSRHFVTGHDDRRWKGIRKGQYLVRKRCSPNALDGEERSILTLEDGCRACDNTSFADMSSLTLTR